MEIYNDSYEEIKTQGEHVNNEEKEWNYGMIAYGNLIEENLKTGKIDYDIEDNLFYDTFSHL